MKSGGDGGKNQGQGRYFKDVNIGRRREKGEGKQDVDTIDKLENGRKAHLCRERENGYRAKCTNSRQKVFCIHNEQLGKNVKESMRSKGQRGCQLSLDGLC